MIDLNKEYSVDLELARSALSGSEEAAQRILQECEPFLQRQLAFYCRGDSASLQKAQEIIADLFSECFGGSSKDKKAKNPLELYQGRCGLRNWLLLCAKSRLKNWWASSAYKNNVPLNQKHDAVPFEELTSEEKEIINLVIKTLKETIDELEARHWVILHLVFFQGVKQERIAQMLHCHPSSITREIANILKILKQKIIGKLHQRDPNLQLNWGSLIQLCQKYSSIINFVMFFCKIGIYTCLVR